MGEKMKVFYAGKLRMKRRDSLVASKIEEGMRKKISDLLTNDLSLTRIIDGEYYFNSWWSSMAKITFERFYNEKGVIELKIVDYNRFAGFLENKDVEESLYRHTLTYCGSFDKESLTKKITEMYDNYRLKEDRKELKGFMKNE